MEFVEFYPVNKILTAEMTFIVVLRKFGATIGISLSNLIPKKGTLTVFQQSV